MPSSPINLFLEALFPTPRNCLLCQAPIAGFGLCEACHKLYEEKRQGNGQCLRCGSFGVRGQACDVCRHWPQYIHRVSALWPYEKEVRTAILAYKYQGKPWMATGFAQAGLPFIPPEVDLLVPVPLHASRLRERGYNQSLLLAKALQDAGGPPVSDALRRIKATPHQVGLSKRARLHNLDGAIRVQRPEAVAGRHVCLIDDVITTGSTIEHCGRALHRAGAAAVSALVLAAGYGSLAGR